MTGKRNFIRKSPRIRGRCGPLDAIGYWAGRLAATEGLTEVQIEILSTVKDFVDKEILPYATDLEHKDEFPDAIVDGMKEMGLFGLTIPEEYGGAGGDTVSYAIATIPLSRHACVSSRSAATRPSGQSSGMGSGRSRQPRTGRLVSPRRIALASSAAR